MSSVAGGVLSGVVSLAMAAGQAIGVGLVVVAVMSFVLANAVMLGVGIGAVALATAGLVRFLLRFTVFGDAEEPARAKATQQVAITRGYPLPRNLAITRVSGHCRRRRSSISTFTCTASHPMTSQRLSTVGRFTP